MLATKSKKVKTPLTSGQQKTTNQNVLVKAKIRASPKPHRRGHTQHNNQSSHSRASRHWTFGARQRVGARLRFCHTIHTLYRSKVVSAENGKMQFCDCLPWAASVFQSSCCTRRRGTLSRVSSSCCCDGRCSSWFRVRCSSFSSHR